MMISALSNIADIINATALLSAVYHNPSALLHCDFFWLCTHYKKINLHPPIRKVPMPHTHTHTNTHTRTHNGGLEKLSKLCLDLHQWTPLAPSRPSCWDTHTTTRPPMYAYYLLLHITASISTTRHLFHIGFPTHFTSRCPSLLHIRAPLSSIDVTLQRWDLLPPGDTPLLHTVYPS